MTDDLIARLRSVDVSWSETGEWCAEAADRIEELEAWKAAEEAHHHMLRQELASLTAEVERLTLTVRKLQGHQGALEAENARLRAALKTAGAWLDRWAPHIGNCPGNDRCTCGLTRARYEVSAAPEGTSHE